MTVTDVEYAILLSKSCDETRADIASVYARQATKLDTDGEQLCAFVNRYLAQLPVSLRTANAAATQAGLRELIVPVTQAVEHFFVRECELTQDGGLLALLDRAYLGHRLLEELNDQLHVRQGLFILHVDMTEANMIVHTLIGEPYASELEGVVHQTMSNLLGGIEPPLCVAAIPGHESLKPFLGKDELRIGRDYGHILRSATHY